MVISLKYGAENMTEVGKYCCCLSNIQDWWVSERKTFLGSNEVEHDFSSSTSETEAGRLRVWGQPGLHSKTLCQKKQTKPQNTQKTSLGAGRFQWVLLTLHNDLCWTFHLLFCPSIWMQDREDTRGSAWNSSRLYGTQTPEPGYWYYPLQLGHLPVPWPPWLFTIETLSALCGHRVDWASL
jgi:hypothetical protein